MKVLPNTDCCMNSFMWLDVIISPEIVDGFRRFFAELLADEKYHA